MIKAERILYLIGVLLIIISIFGGSIFKNIFTKMSEQILTYTGLKYGYVLEYDGKIDDLFFGVRQAQLQIEKIKNFFSREQIDESKYGKVENKIIENSVYRPVIEFLSGLLRILFIFLAVFLLMAGFISGLLERSKSLKRRIEILEQKVSLLE